MTWRLSAYAPADAVEPQASFGEGAGAAKGTRAVRFRRGEAAVDTPVYRRPDLGVGQRIEGPAIVEERETTAVIRPGWVAEVAGGRVTDREQERGGRAAA